MDKLVGCNIIDTTEKDGVWIHQQKSLKHIMPVFQDHIKQQLPQLQRPLLYAIKKVVQ
jgi:hypothetical protein